MLGHQVHLGRQAGSEDGWEVGENKGRLAPQMPELEPQDDGLKPTAVFAVSGGGDKGIL